MKLNLNAKEILALHNLLQARCCAGGSPADIAESDEVQLRQVFNRLRALLLGALSNKHAVTGSTNDATAVTIL